MLYESLMLALRPKYIAFNAAANCMTDCASPHVIAYVPGGCIY
jgi:hypothetical protein